MIQFEPGKRVVEEIETGGRRWRLVSAMTSVRAGTGKTGVQFSYLRPQYVESPDGRESWPIVDHTMLARLTAVVVALLMTVRSIFR